MPTVLVILPEGFEEIEALTPIDLLRRAGAEVTIASLGTTPHVTGRCNITMHADTTLTETAGKTYDLILLPGGPGTLNLRGDMRVRELVQKQAAEGRWLAAICAAPTVLNDAGLLQNRRYTAHTSVEKELGHVLKNERTIVDGKIVTSRGAGTALDFGLKLVETLVSPEKAREITIAICA